jgi:hypothetical protein
MAIEGTPKAEALAGVITDVASVAAGLRPDHISKMVYARQWGNWLASAHQSGGVCLFSIQPARVDADHHRRGNFDFRSHQGFVVITNDTNSCHALGIMVRKCFNRRSGSLVAAGAHQLGAVLLILPLEHKSAFCCHRSNCIGVAHPSETIILLSCLIFIFTKTIVFSTR